MEIPKHMYHKTFTLNTWRRSGLICDNFDELYDMYISTLNCNHCKKEFKTTRDRCMDHDHATGLFRSIVCRSCNNSDSYVKYPNNDYDSKKARYNYYHKNKVAILQQQKIKYEENKDYILQRQKQYHQRVKDLRSSRLAEKITCDCGSIISRSTKSRHLGTNKHKLYLLHNI